MHNGRLPLLLFLLLTAAVLAPATTLTNPLFGKSTNCSYTMTPPYITDTAHCAVIGDPLNYDIQKLDFSIGGGEATATVYFNYDHGIGGSSLAPYTDDGVTVQAGDIFFYDPADPQTMKYAIALYGNRPNSAQNFAPGSLYRIDGSTVKVETAEQALNYNGSYYRRDLDVLMTANGAPPSPAANGQPVDVTPIAGADGISAPFLKATVQFQTPADFLSLIRNNSIGVMFSSGDCGNGMIKGELQTPVPEPAPAGPIGGVLLMLAAVALSRRRARALTAAK